MSFWAELKRRNVVRVAVAYAIVGWLLTQIADTLLPAFGAPDWVLPVFILLLATGFIVAMFISWAYELTPQGMVRTEAVAAQQSITRITGRKLDFVIIAVLVLALGYVALDQYVLEERGQGPRAADTAAADRVRGTSVLPAQIAAALPNSIAVLPFDNLSPNADDAYFAAGLHEEILNQLAGLSELTVIARTTMRQYANTTKSMGQIAGELNVEAVMEGSVRYASNRVRVTAQLIDPMTDGHLWSATYERDFDDIFAIESDIAMNVANAMAIEYSLAEQNRIEQAPTNSSEAYALFLASAIAGEDGSDADIDASMQRIDAALVLDPGFAGAWATKASIYTYATAIYPERFDELIAVARDSAQRALALDPDSPGPRVSLAMIATAEGDWQRAGQEFEAGGVGHPREPLAAFQFIVGETATAYEGIEAVRTRDPLSPDPWWWIVAAHDTLGDAEASLTEYERGRALFRNWPLGDFHAFVTLLGIDGRRAMDFARENLSGPAIAAAAENLDDPEAAMAALHTLYDGDPGIDRQRIAILAAYFGDRELALDALRTMVLDLPIRGHIIWRPIFADVRRMDGFKAFVRELGLVDYWRNFGWPDFCQLSSGDDFECR